MSRIVAAWREFNDIQPPSSCARARRLFRTTRTSACFSMEINGAGTVDDVDTPEANAVVSFRGAGKCSGTLLTPQLVHPFTASGTPVRHLSCLPSAQASKTKSYAQAWFGPVGGARHLEPRRSPEPMGAVDAHAVSVTAEKDADSTVAVAWVLRRELARPLHHGRVGELAFRGVARTGARDGRSVHARRRASFQRLRVGYLQPTTGHAHHFFELMSFSTSISSIQSTRSLFSFALSCSRLFSRFAHRRPSSRTFSAIGRWSGR